MPADQLAWFHFYPDDWIRDTGLRSVSFAARGLWIDLLCLMDRSPRRGVLLDSKGGKLPTKAIARSIGANPLALGKLIAELDLAGVLSIGEGGEIFCRRMVRDTEIRQQKRNSGTLGGNPVLKQPVKHEVKLDIEKRREEKRREEEIPTVSCSASAEPVQKPPKKSKASKPDLDYADFPGFADFWKAYPAPAGGKYPALESWVARGLERCPGPVVQAARDYAEWIKAVSRPDFKRQPKNAVTWLNNREDLQDWSEETDKARKADEDEDDGSPQPYFNPEWSKIVAAMDPAPPRQPRLPRIDTPPGVIDWGEPQPGELQDL